MQITQDRSDFLLMFDGSLAVVTPMNTPALDWWDEHVGAGFTWGHGFVVERDHLKPTLQGAVDDGFTVGPQWP